MYIKYTTYDDVIEVLMLLVSAPLGMSFGGGLASGGEPTSGFFNLQKIRTRKKICLMGHSYLHKIFSKV